MSKPARNRVVILSGPDLVQRQTCATLIDRGVNVVGICYAGGRVAGVPLDFIRMSIKKKGWGKTLSQVAGRLVYLAANRRADARIFRRLYDPAWIEGTLAGYEGPVHITQRYSEPDCLRWLKSLAPDVFVIHTAQFVGKKVRAIPAKNLTIGGHPGLVPPLSRLALGVLGGAQRAPRGHRVFHLLAGRWLRHRRPHRAGTPAPGGR